MHLSLDAWNTVLIPNTIFCQKRNEMVSKLFNIQSEVLEQAHIITKHHIQIDTVEHLKSYDPLDSFKLLMIYLDMEFKQDLFHVWYCLTRYLFLEYPPIILPETINAINKWCEHNTWGISSNTNFITGSILNHYITKSINKSGLNTYSDLEHFVKPDPKFFDIIKAKVRYKNPDTTIIHVGDDISCDIKGAKKANLDFLWCDKPENLSKIITSL